MHKWSALHSLINNLTMHSPFSTADVNNYDYNLDRLESELVASWGFTTEQHLKSYQDSQQLVEVSMCGASAGLYYWYVMPQPDLYPNNTNHGKRERHMSLSGCTGIPSSAGISGPNTSGISFTFRAGSRYSKPILHFGAFILNRKHYNVHCSDVFPIPH